MNSWGEAGLEETAQRLGYRFVLTSSTVTSQADDTATVSVDVRNDGWAAPYTPRNAVLALTATDGSTINVPFESNADARFWLSGTTTTLSVTLDEVPEGSYALALALPSVDAEAAHDECFAVQPANVDTWNAANGTNALAQSIVVDQAVVPGEPVSAASTAASGPSGASLAATGQPIDAASVIGIGAAALAVLALGSVLIAARRRA